MSPNHPRRTGTAPWSGCSRATSPAAGPSTSGAGAAKELPPRPFPQPRWDGGPLGGKTILLHAEQGLGDTLQFIRYAPLVKRRGGTVVVACQRPLIPLLQGCPGIDRLAAQGDPLPPFDVHAPLLSLPLLFGTDLESIPADVPYLRADPALIEHWRGRLADCPGFKVGVAWQGSDKHKRDPRVPSRWRVSSRWRVCRGCGWSACRRAPEASRRRALAGRFPVAELPGLDEGNGPFVDTAVVLSCLDLVVCCDTAVGHLAGALGVPCWLALAAAPDWRWLLGRGDSPWYPRHRLFRQDQPGDWDGVFRRIAEALRQRTAGVPPVVTVEVSPGELLDKITILEIKSQRIVDPAKRRNVAAELRAGSGAAAGAAGDGRAGRAGRGAAGGQRGAVADRGRHPPLRPGRRLRPALRRAGPLRLPHQRPPRRPEAARQRPAGLRVVEEKLYADYGDGTGA